MSEFSPILIYLVISSLVSLIPLGLPFPFSSNSLTYPKIFSAYECGFDPSGDARSHFDIRFYLVLILFIIPDPEVTFSFPLAVPPKKIDPFGSWSMMAFLFILTIGSGVTTSDRAKIGGKDKGNSDAYIQSIDSSW